MSDAAKYKPKDSDYAKNQKLDQMRLKMKSRHEKAASQQNTSTIKESPRRAVKNKTGDDATVPEEPVH
jgi:hypothetical protein